MIGKRLPRPGGNRIRILEMTGMRRKSPTSKTEVRNPAVRAEFLDICTWWYRRGVAGFRLDAVDTLFEDPQLRDNPVLPGLNAYGDPRMTNANTTKIAATPRKTQGLFCQRPNTLPCNAATMGQKG